MKISVWRITREKYLDEAFTGEGAKIWGGRWNPVGHPAVYCAENLSLAILELIVHLDSDIDINNYIAIPASFSEKSVKILTDDRLPQTWDHLPIGPASMGVGKTWLDEKKFMVLKVPSTIAPIEHNFILNPLHPDFPQLEIGEPQKIRFDPRIADLT